LVTVGVPTTADKRPEEFTNDDPLIGGGANDGRQTLKGLRNSPCVLLIILLIIIIIIIVWTSWKSSVAVTNGWRHACSTGWVTCGVELWTYWHHD
jgi:hypothetical protein